MNYVLWASQQPQHCVSGWDCVCAGGCPPSSWRPLCVGSSPNMTELSLLTQGDWAEGTTAHNRGTMAAPLVLMGDTCNRIRVRTPGGGTTWGDGTSVPPIPNPKPETPTPPCPVPLHQTCTKPGLCCRGTEAAHHDVLTLVTCTGCPRLCGTVLFLIQISPYFPLTFYLTILFFLWMCCLT